MPQYEHENDAIVIDMRNVIVPVVERGGERKTGYPMRVHKPGVEIVKFVDDSVRYFVMTTTLQLDNIVDGCVRGVIYD